MRPAAKVRCSYCGEKLWMEVDADEGSTVAEFIEDCEVCCRPIVFSGYFDESGRLRLSARTDSMSV
jgi:hypothetical protein